MVDQQNVGPDATSVAINAASLRGKGSSYVGSSLTAFIHASPLLDLRYLWRPEGAGGQLPEATGHARPGLVNKIVVDQLRVRRRSRETDILISLGDTGTFRPPVPHLLFVQQALLLGDIRHVSAGSHRFASRVRALRAYFRATIPAVQHFVVQTRTMRDGLIAEWGIAPDKVSVIAVPAPSLGQPSPAPPRRERTRPELRVAFVATSDPYKNLAALPAAVQAARRRGVPAVFEVVEHPSLAQNLGPLNGGDQVTVKWRNRLPQDAFRELLQSCDVAVIPSLCESYGLVYDEAMRFGRPMIVANTPIARERCESAALYFDFDSPDQIGSHLAQLMNAATYAKYSARASDAANRLPCIDAVAEEWISTVISVAGS